MELNMEKFGEGVKKNTLWNFHITNEKISKKKKDISIKYIFLNILGKPDQIFSIR